MPGDEELARRAGAGDSAALEVLVRRHHDGVFRLAASLLRDDQAAADVTQEVFLKAMRGIRSFRGDASFRSWIFSIARNEAVEEARRMRRSPLLPPDALDRQAATSPDPLEGIHHRRNSRRLREAVEHLPEKQRLAVSLRIYEGLPYREVARIIGSSEGAARVNYHHGIQRLKEWLSHD